MTAKARPDRATGQMPMDLFEARAKIEAIRATTAAAEAAYHQRDEPMMTDGDYDALASRDDAIVASFPDAEDSPRPVGARPAPGFRAVPHGAPMLSLANAGTREALEAFVATVRAALAPLGKDAAFACEHKVDGVSLSLAYRDGRLETALTRGDGVEGEDVTANARGIAGIPALLPPGTPASVEVRGEAYMAKQDLAAANGRRTRDGKEPFANLRNAAAGSIRHSDPEETRARRLSFAAYGIGHASEPVAGTEGGLLGILRRWGFATVAEATRCETPEAVWSAFERLGAERHRMDHEIDGAVVKLDDIGDRAVLGATGRTPRWALALKFPADRATTRLTGIEVQVGRSGTLTPVARLEPVRVGGVTVTNATLHNADHVASLGLAPGDIVEVERAGDVIPRVLGRAPGRPPAPAAWRMPTSCPACGARAARDEGRAATRCSNAMSCPASAVARFAHVTGRDIFDIDGLGDGRLEPLVATGLLREPADLWRLHRHRDAIRRSPGWGDLSTDNLLASVEARRTLPLHRLIASLCIREVGRTAGRLIAQRHGTLTATMEAMKEAARDRGALEALTAIPGMGPVMAGEVAAWFSEPSNTAALARLLEEITVMDHATATPAPGSVLAGKSIVFTGKLYAGTRDQAEDVARGHGGKPSSGVSAATDILVVGENAGSKLAKANALNAKGAKIHIMTEEEWTTMTSAGTT